MVRIAAAGDGTAVARQGASTFHQARLVLVLRPFRRLWLVTGLCSSADWLTVLALAALASSTATSATGVNFALPGVLFANLLPGLLFAPIGGLLADRFDRRTVMAAADVVRFGLLLSIAFADTYWWIFAGTFLMQVATILWIPCKDAALPNLLRRPEQLPAATQVGLVMTYGLSVLVGGGLFVLVTGAGTVLQLPAGFFGTNGLVKAAIVLAALFYLGSAAMIVTRLPELSLHTTAASAPHTEEQRPPRLWEMVRDGAGYVWRTPLVRGLLLGMMGALAAGGAVVGAAQSYVLSLGGGQAAFGLLLLAIFLGLITGLVGAPKLAPKLPQERLFGAAIIVAGTALVPMALSPHIVVSLVASVVVGAAAGATFLTGVTIIGSRVEDSMRGRVNAVYQAMLKVVLGCSVALSSLLVTMMQTRTMTLWRHTFSVDGTRPVILAGGLLAVLVGVLAYRQMDTRRAEPILADLRGVIRPRPHAGSGLLITVEGSGAADTAEQATRLTSHLRARGHHTVLFGDVKPDDDRLAALVLRASPKGHRAWALAAAAVRADIVECQVRPALTAGTVVVMERVLESRFSTAADVDRAELRSLADWAGAKLRPDLVVLLDTPTVPAGEATAAGHWSVEELVSEIATVASDRYLLVDADGSADEVAERVTSAIDPVLSELFPCSDR
ncbi:dTMP kinase [Amycolatopsis marina]|uniref:dTMP kinase n=1 Tax=Amycolatopsis marina TaxID=490629 RepID=A0A1I1BWL5_9PSEU|nr:MFS transporter [Amycolatopsis marina]SFB54527.1 dTMP kinase [Amycolatopsis marina]